MPNQIGDAVIHKLIKESGQRSASLELRPQVLLINDHVQRLIDLICKHYSEQVGKGFGKFEADANEYPVQTYLSEHLSTGGTSFLAMSNALMQHLQTRSIAELFSTGGFVLIAKIISEGHEYLICAIVNEVTGVAITQSLNVVESPYLDMKHMRVAGRIDLTQWRASGERYISFLKGRADISDYFKRFLGCNDIHVPVQETKNLVSVLKEFASRNDLGPLERDQLLDLAYQRLLTLSKNKQPVDLEAFSNEIWPSDPQALRNIMSEAIYTVSDGFVPDKRAFKFLVEFSGKATDWELSFTRQALRAGQITYDLDSDSLTVHELPADLSAELKLETQRNDTD